MQVNWKYELVNCRKMAKEWTKTLVIANISMADVSGIKQKGRKPRELSNLTPGIFPNNCKM